MNHEYHSIATLAKSVTLLNPERSVGNRTVRRPSMATINIQNLRLRANVGLNPEERIKQQDVVINVIIQHNVNSEVFKDSIGHTPSYKEITKKIISFVEQGRFLLLEKLVADILQICTDHPCVTRASVNVDIPHALRLADSVSLTMEYINDQYEHWTC